jgi:hypothetical protein
MFRHYFITALPNLPKKRFLHPSTSWHVSQYCRFPVVGIISSSAAGWLALNITIEKLDLVQLMMYMVAFIAGTTLIAFYPAYFVSSYNPVLFLKNKLKAGRVDPMCCTSH